MRDCNLWLAGEPMAELCREFGIARKTGYKIFDRYPGMRPRGLISTVLAVSVPRNHASATIDGLTFNLRATLA